MAGIRNEFLPRTKHYAAMLNTAELQNAGQHNVMAQCFYISNFYKELFKNFDNSKSLKNWQEISDNFLPQT